MGVFSHLPPTFSLLALVSGVVVGIVHKRVDTTSGLAVPSAYLVRSIDDRRR